MKSPGLHGSFAGAFVGTPSSGIFMHGVEL